MTRSVSILITGSELLDGRVLDTNTRLVAEELSSLGIPLQRVLFVDDDIHELERGFKILSEVSDFIIVSGGMGPTTDDLTREASAMFLGRALVEDPQARRHLEEMYAKRNRVVDEHNSKQALIPEGSSLIPNPTGTAPGFRGLSQRGVTLFALPGVPKEFTEMFHATVLPFLKEELGSRSDLCSLGFRIFGLPEGEVGKRVRQVAFPEALQISFRATFPEIHIKIKGPFLLSDLITFQDHAIASVGEEFVFSKDISKGLVESLSELLVENGSTVAVAESCTGGMIGEMLTSISGSSRYFAGGILAYSNAVKQQELEVEPRLLSNHGAVSAEVVAQMATTVRRRFATQYGVSISGIAGPDGGSTEKPVGTVFIGLADNKGVRAYKLFYPGERGRIRRYASYVAIDCLRRELSGIQVDKLVERVDIS